MKEIFSGVLRRTVGGMLAAGFLIFIGCLSLMLVIFFGGDVL